MTPCAQALTQMAYATQEIELQTRIKLRTYYMECGLIIDANRKVIDKGIEELQ